MGSEISVLVHHPRGVGEGLWITCAGRDLTTVMSSITGGEASLNGQCLMSGIVEAVDGMGSFLIEEAMVDALHHPVVGGDMIQGREPARQ